MPPPDEIAPTIPASPPPPATPSEPPDAAHAPTEPGPPPPGDTAPETPDAKAADKPPEPPPDPKVAARFAALAKKERELTTKAAEWKPKLEAAEKFEAARAKVKEDPYAALEALGINLQELVDAAIHHNKPETVEDRVARLEGERAAAAKERESLSARQVEETIATHRASVAAFVDADPDAYELVVARKAQHVVFEVIEEHFKATGELMPTSKAAEMVENHLLEEARGMLKLKKLAGHAPAQANGAATNGAAPQGETRAAPPSLSAQATKPNPAPAPTTPEYETHDAAIRRITDKIKAAGNVRT